MKRNIIYNNVRGLTSRVKQPAVHLTKDDGIDVEYFLKKCGKSQKDVASKMGKSNPLITFIIKGDRGLTEEFVNAVLYLLDDSYREKAENIFKAYGFATVKNDVAVHVNIVAQKDQIINPGEVNRPGEGGE